MSADVWKIGIIIVIATCILVGAYIRDQRRTAKMDWHKKMSAEDATMRAHLPENPPSFWSKFVSRKRSPR